MITPDKITPFYQRPRLVLEALLNLRPPGSLAHYDLTERQKGAAPGLEGLYLGERLILHALHTTFGWAYPSPLDLTPRPGLSAQLCQELRVWPYTLQSGVLTLLMVDPTDSAAQQRVQAETGHTVMPGLIGVVALERLLRPLVPGFKPLSEALAPITPRTLGQIMELRGWMSALDTERTARYAYGSGLRFGEAALKLGLASEARVTEALAVQYGLSFDPHASRRSPSSAARTLLERAPLAAWRTRAVPMSVSDTHLEWVGGLSLLETGAGLQEQVPGHKVTFTLTTEREWLAVLERLSG